MEEVVCERIDFVWDSVKSNAGFTISSGLEIVKTLAGDVFLLTEEEVVQMRSDGGAIPNSCVSLGKESYKGRVVVQKSFRKGVLI